VPGIRELFGFETLFLVSGFGGFAGRISGQRRKNEGHGNMNEPEKPQKDRAWFERKVAELESELEQLPTDRQAELKKELENGKAAE